MGLYRHCLCRMCMFVLAAAHVVQVWASKSRYRHLKSHNSRLKPVLVLIMVVKMKRWAAVTVLLSTLWSAPVRDTEKLQQFHVNDRFQLEGQKWQTWLKLHLHRATVHLLVETDPSQQPVAAHWWWDSTNCRLQERGWSSVCVWVCSLHSGWEMVQV